MACKHICWKDRDTGETFCPVMHRWVDDCPLQDGDRDYEMDEEGEEDDK